MTNSNDVAKCLDATISAFQAVRKVGDCIPQQQLTTTTSSRDILLGVTVGGLFVGVAAGLTLAWLEYRDNKHTRHTHDCCSSGTPTNPVAPRSDIVPQPVQTSDSSTNMTSSATKTTPITTSPTFGPVYERI